MSFNASDYIKPPSPEYATDRELQGDQTDLKINDLRRDTITCINALASGAPSGSVTVDSINPTPVSFTGTKNMTPPVINGLVQQQLVSTPVGVMLLNNCSYDGSVFTSTSGFASASGIILAGAGMTLLSQENVASPWVAWDKQQVFIPGSSIYSTTISGTGFSVYGAISQTNATVSPITVVLPYNAEITWTPTFNLVILSNINMNAATATLTDVSNRAVKVTMTPSAPGDVSVVFYVDVALP